MRRSWYFVGVGMYQPGQGGIEVDGTPLTALDPEAWRARCTAAFQDFSRFNLAALESVGRRGPGRRRDLLAANGRYAELFSLQADAHRWPWAAFRKRIRGGGGEPRAPAGGLDSRLRKIHKEIFGAL